ncbi:aminoglycoside phosphotransferase family protein [Pseudonocardiaceae bacterium YIM PH 21723]|nr:aminoglycoside phosphotransferase family protein [Pseudonocardiaceae bacterium YIM PH 21723]
MPRTVTLVLVDPTGTPLGELPPITVPAPWWQEVDDLVAGIRAVHGIDVVILRLLSADRPAPPGGAVRYLAEYDGPPPAALRPATPEAGPHPLRMPWARPGGPAASLDWARTILGELTGVQRRTWNLSSIWRLDTAAGRVWLKEVPPFAAHEAAVLDWLAVPWLLAADGGRMLLEHVPGGDRYDAALPEVRDMLADLLTVQTTALGRAGELVELGVPDAWAPEFVPAAHAVMDRWIPMLDMAERVVVARLGDRLPERLAAVAACGLPDTLVHGDFHPGNVRGTGTRRVILDWADCVVGHPALDLLTVLDQRKPDDQRVLAGQWCAFWRRAVPGCDPERALGLMRPVAALHRAVKYANFLAAIEPSEHPFHAADPPAWLRLAAATR